MRAKLTLLERVAEIMCLEKRWDNLPSPSFPPFCDGRYIPRVTAFFFLIFFTRLKA